MASGGNQRLLPPEIMNKILVRLPAKSIVRFQCVCKEWKNLSKSPSFIAEHFNHQPDRNNPFLLLHEYSDEHRRSSLYLLDHKMETVDVLRIPSIGAFRRKWRIIGSCNGLLCVQVDDGRRRSHSLWLWNPLIREVREVPSTRNDKRVCRIGFGFSSVANDYKIVRFYTPELPKKKSERVYYCNRIDHVEVYSLSTDSWKELEFVVLHLSHALLNKSVNVDGTIFWLAKTSVVSFDIATEVVKITAILSEDASYPLWLGVYENKLVCHYGFREEDGSYSASVCMMEEVASQYGIEYGNNMSCTQKYRIDQGSHDLHTLCVWGNEMVCLDKEYVSEVEGDPKCVLRMFNLNNNEETKFNCSTSYGWCDAFNYEKSLVSVWNTQQVE
ncbi:hypothetical protein QN277_009551 [Acacia crassicarpa]|uniref:F-box domain-containing protein n=1 Tax=Acacia crassicarpa TaxID=499986 RepID=A0AAE1MBY9_9FABA|nr:hypothetical protein QN277_009551 [Acacia crassicarpa]